MRKQPDNYYTKVGKVVWPSVKDETRKTPERYDLKRIDSHNLFQLK